VDGALLERPRIIDGKYEILRELSKGGMGAVYEARHVLTRRKVALKLVLAERLARARPSDAIRRFEREARAAGSIESRHVVSVLDTGVDARTNDPYIVMELLSGEDLRQLVRRAGRLPPELVLAVAAQVCLGLRRAHEQGVIHRDIKPSNIYLARRDDGHVEVKILDFGIAKLRVDPLASSDGHDLTRSGSVLGSPLYMSPEQATGSRELDARSDIWSLGIVMYEALTGQTPHENQALGAVILAICSQPARPLRECAPWVSAEIAALVHRAIALEPGQRFATAEEMQGALSALLPNGAVVHESALSALVHETTFEIPSATHEPVSAGSPMPSGQTTIDSVTHGTGSRRDDQGTVRARSRLAGVLVALVVLVVVVGFWRHRAGTQSADAKPALSSAVASAVAPGEPRPPPAALVRREGIVPSFGTNGTAGAHAVSSAARTTERRIAEKPRTSQRPPERALTPMPRGPTAPSASVVAPAQPRVMTEPESDRRFD
jgi:serine/threonine protein kinase